jgi:hypothetical protein
VFYEENASPNAILAAGRRKIKNFGNAVSVSAKLPCAVLKAIMAMKPSRSF